MTRPFLASLVAVLGLSIAQQSPRDDRLDRIFSIDDAGNVTLHVESIILGQSDDGYQQRIDLVRRCGSFDKQSAVRINPIRATNGALLILENGKDVPVNHIGAEILKHFAFSLLLMT